MGKLNCYICKKRCQCITCINQNSSNCHYCDLSNTIDFVCDEGSEYKEDWIKTLKFGKGNKTLLPFYSVPRLKIRLKIKVK